MPARGSENDRPSKSEPVAEALDQISGLQHDAAEPRARRDVDLLEVELAVALRLGGELLVAGEPGLALGLARLGVGADPLQLALQDLGPLGVLAALDLEAGLLGVEVGRVVALVRVGPAAVELEDPLGDVVEEVPIVGDGQHGTGIGLEVTLQPVHRLGVEVVGRLVEQQQVGLLQQQLAERHPAALAAGEDVDRRVRRRAAQGIHRLLELGVDVPRVAVVELGLHLAHLGHQRVEVGVRLTHRGAELVHPGLQRLDVGDRLLDVLQDGLALGQRRLLQQDADGGVLGQHGVAVVGGLQPGHQLQQRRLARAVRTDDADLRARVERQRHVVQHDLVAERLADVVHREDELGHVEQEP